MSSKPPSELPGEILVRVVLDGQPVSLPAERRSINAIRCYLETLALERQRVLFTFTVDGAAAKPCPDPERTSFVQVEGTSVDLIEMPLRLIETALQQSADAHTVVESAISVVLINGGRPAREVWWDLTRKLKDPLLTLSLLPEGLFAPMKGVASPLQLRRWQLQQLAAIIRDVDDACWSPDPIALSNALENRVLPWLDKLHQSIMLLHETTVAANRSAATRVEPQDPVAI